MSDVFLPLLILMTLAAPGAIDGEQREQTPPGRRTITEVTTVQSRIIIRIPRLPVGRTPLPSSSAMSAPLPPLRWVERKSEKCVPAETLAGAAISSADSVDLILSGGKRMRARFDDDCPALDFYSGLYVKIHGDGQLCASRDSIRSRSGGECRIESFAALVPGR